MTYLRLDDAGLARANALHTAREIEQQPRFLGAPRWH